VTAALRTLESLRAQGLLEAQRDLVIHERELMDRRAARDLARVKRVQAERALAKLRQQFAAASLLADLRWLELGLLGAAKELESALLQEGTATRLAEAAEQRLRDAEGKVREHAVGRRAVAQVLERERLAEERQAAQCAEDEAEDQYRSRGRP
jgi:hypothetical protein